MVVASYEKRISREANLSEWMVGSHRTCSFGFSLKFVWSYFVAKVLMGVNLVFSLSGRDNPDKYPITSIGTNERSIRYSR